MRFNLGAFFLFLFPGQPGAIIAPRQQLDCAQPLIVTATASHFISLLQTTSLTRDRVNSFLVSNNYPHVSVHSTATMPPRRGRGGQAGGAPSPAPDPSPRAQRTGGPSRFSTSYGSPSMYAAARSSTSSSLDGIGSAVRSVRDSNAADGQSRGNQRPSRADSQGARPSNNGGPGAPPPGPPVVPPPLDQQPLRPANNNQRRFLDIYSPLMTVTHETCFVCELHIFFSNLVVQGPHLVYGPRPFNHHANLAGTIQGRLGSCQCRCTLIPRPTGALSRRASSTMVQTLGRRNRRDRREAPQADGMPRHHHMGLISLMTMMMRILCSMIRPAAREDAGTQIRPHDLHRAIGL